MSDRHAATAGADHRRAAFEQLLDERAFDDVDRVGAGNHPPPAIPVGGDSPTPLGGEPVGVALGIGRADELGRRVERRIGGIDQRLGHEAHDRTPETGGRDRALQPVPDQPLCLRDQGIEGIRPRQRVVVGALERQQAHLGSVAVGDHQLMVGGDGGKGRGNGCDVFDLDRGVRDRSAGQQRVAPQGDQDAHSSTGPSTSGMAAAGTTTTGQFAVRTQWRPVEPTIRSTRPWGEAPTTSIDASADASTSR